MSSVTNAHETTNYSLDELKMQFDAYEEGVRGSYLFVSVGIS
jgi:hypothetical protein